ncbi:hypothetical protein [Streptomyces glomeratus]|uniref:Uncharacterized protein n=1 Tax=Streptomyces glomeratus TaxID=284452 RepID=A0ABP6LCU9_9ACTN|nr:hypothetical protein [Streptomyces glomeratus]MCF1509840.1 hypothetical protein [Streptomyces glomeratus]
MRLGKALATGVAEEHPEAHEEEAGLQVTEVVEEPAASAPAEVPAAR